MAPGGRNAARANKAPCIPIKTAAEDIFTIKSSISLVSWRIKVISEAEGKASCNFRANSGSFKINLVLVLDAINITGPFSKLPFVVVTDFKEFKASRTSDSVNFDFSISKN